MVTKWVNAILSSAALLIPTILSATPADDIINDFVSVFFSETRIKKTPFEANLGKYKVNFFDQTIPDICGYVDREGSYLTFGSKIMTKPETIQYIIDHSTLLDYNLYGELNLNAYAGRIFGNPLSQIIFVDMDLQYAIIKGSLFDSNFDNKTFDAADANIHNDWATFLYFNFKKLPAIVQGDPDAPKQIFVYGEPNCPICNELYDSLLSFVEAGNLSIHWTLISFIQPDSRGKVFAIWDGDVPPGAQYPHTPLGAFQYNEDNFATGSDDGGAIPPSSNPSQRAICEANASEFNWMKHLYQGTPFILFRDASGQPDYVIGLPPDINAFVADLFVCPNPPHCP